MSRIDDRHELFLVDLPVELREEDTVLLEEAIGRLLVDHLLVEDILPVGAKMARGLGGVKERSAVRKMHSGETSASTFLGPIRHPLPYALGLLGSNIFGELFSFLKAPQLLLRTSLHQNLQVVPDLVEVHVRGIRCSLRAVT